MTKLNQRFDRIESKISLLLHKNKAMNFDIVSNDLKSNARAGVLHTGHGPIETPIFMPVGTAGTVKACHIRDVRDEVKTQIILGNTYHLYLRPGLEVLEAVGGLHKFNGWDRPILTDSGGFQVFSLTGIRKMKEEGVTFQSHIDGSRHLFTPENVMDIQRSIGADIMMAFDECTPGTADYQYAKQSMERTHRWLDRCCDRFYSTEPKYGYEQALFPIVQGCVYRDLREQSAEFIASKNAAGNAIGGLAVGEPTEKMYEMIELVNTILPKDKPRYLMGVGTPANILEGISRGVDMFDCVMPTRNGRNGMIFTSEGIINLFHLRRHHQPQKRKVEVRLLSRRPEWRNFRGCTIFEGLSASFVRRGRNPRPDDCEFAQHWFLPLVGARGAQAHHWRRLCPLA